MATATLIPVEEYLQTSYRPDCDYIDGEVLERNVGERKHSRLQMRILAWLFANEGKFGFCTLPEMRLKVGERRYRIPDVVVVAEEAPFEKVVMTPPLLCVEVLSPGDTLNSIWDRIEDYLSLGVPVCWILDPEARSAWTATPLGVNRVHDGVLRAGGIAMPLAEVFE